MLWMYSLTLWLKKVSCDRLRALIAPWGADFHHLIKKYTSVQYFTIIMKYRKLIFLCNSDRPRLIKTGDSVCCLRLNHFSQFQIIRSPLTFLISMFYKVLVSSNLYDSYCLQRTFTMNYFWLFKTLVTCNLYFSLVKQNLCHCFYRCNRNISSENLRLHIRWNNICFP